MCYAKCAAKAGASDAAGLRTLAGPILVEVMDFGDLFAVGLGAIDHAHRFARQLFRRAVEHDPAGRHADDAVAVGPGGVERVQVGDDGDAVAQIDVLQRIHHHLCVHRIERGDRLVGEDHFRLLHQRTGDCDALLLAA